MPPLSESRLLRLVVLGALYFAQGVPWGFVSVGWLVFLTDQGLTNTGVGDALTLAYLPWSFKVVWGPLLDRFAATRFGRRRPYIIAAEALMGATMLLLAFADPKRGLGWMTALLVLNNVFASLQDVASDALAVDILPEHERGKANSVMWACKLGGSMLGGSGGTIFAKHVGWPVVFVVMAVILWAVMALLIVVRERSAGAVAPAQPPDFLPLFREAWRSFAFPTAIAGVLIALLTPAGYALISAPHTRLLRADLAFSEERIALLSSLLPNLAGVAGALLGGPLADRIGPRKVMGGFMVGIAAALAVFALVPHLWPSISFHGTWTVVFQFCIGAYSAAALGFFMTLSNPAVGATQFTIFMAGTNLTYSWTSAVGGRIADAFGFPALFAVAAVMQLLAIALLPLCDARVAEARFRPQGGRQTPRPPTPLPEVQQAPGN